MEEYQIGPWETTEIQCTRNFQQRHTLKRALSQHETIKTNNIGTLSSSQYNSSTAKLPLLQSVAVWDDSIAISNK